MKPQQLRPLLRAFCGFLIRRHQAQLHKVECSVVACMQALPVKVLLPRISSGAMLFRTSHLDVPLTAPLIAPTEAGTVPWLAQCQASSRAHKQLLIGCCTRSKRDTAS